MKFKYFLILLSYSLAFTQNNYPPKINADETVTYKQTPQTDLKLWIFYPDNYKKNDAAACIVFFFGGSWSWIQALGAFIVGLGVIVAQIRK